MKMRTFLFGMSALALCIVAIAGLTISDDAYASATGTANVPLVEIDTNAYDLLMSGNTWYVYPNSPVTVTTYNDNINNISAEVYSVTAGYGLTVTDGELDGNIIGQVSVTINLNNNGTTTTETVLINAEQMSVRRIIYDANDGTGTMDDSIQIDPTEGWGMMFLSECGFTRTGYTFTGWNVGGTTYSPGQSISVSTATPKIAVAQWSEDPSTQYTHTIAYHPGYGPNSETMSNTVVTNGISLPTDVPLSANGFTREGYTFIGWIRNIGDSVAYQPDMSIRVSGNSTTTVYAKWIQTPVSYTHTLQFDAQGGTGTMAGLTVTDNIVGASLITLPACTYTKEGYTFSGWRIIGGTYLNNNSYVDIDGFVLQPDDTIMVKSNTVALAIAQWESTGATYTHTITYDPNGGIGTMEDTVVTDNTSGDTLVYLAYNLFYNSGRNFNGWLVNGTLYNGGQRVPVAGNTTITAVAQWTQTYNHIIIYLPNGGEGFMNSTTVTDSNSGTTDVTLAENEYTKTNAVFVGWLVGEDILQPGDTVPITGGTAIGATAQWEQSYTHTVRYLANGGSGTMENTVVTDAISGDTNVVLAECEYTKTNNQFTGWLVDGTTYQPGDTVAVAGESVVNATAQWNENTLSASASNITGFSQNTYTSQILATASNDAVVTYSVVSSTGGTATVDESGLVTYIAPTVSVISTYTITAMVTATFSNQILTQNVTFTAMIQPIASGVQIQSGDADRDIDRAGDGYHITSIEYNDQDCDFFIGPHYEDTYTESILDDVPQIGAMIGIIPLLIIIGIIVYVARNMTVSRR